MVCARRPLYESRLRQAVETESNVTVCDGSAVTDVTIRAGEVPIVTGVVTADGHTIGGDFFVDAAGRRSPLPAVSYIAEFDDWTEANIGVWYRPQAQADSSLVRRMYAAMHGQPSPPAEPIERLRSTALSASRTDANVAAFLRRMIHLVSLPKEVFGDHAVLTELKALVPAVPN